MSFFVTGVLRSALFRRPLFCTPLLYHRSIQPCYGLQQLFFFSTKGRRKKMPNENESVSDKASLSRKEEALQQALDQIEASFGKGSIMWLNRIHKYKEVPVISTGSLALDLALGIGGLPKGRVVEIYGPEASGKTTLALHVIAEAQKTGGYCAYIDAEHALDPAFAEAIGVRTENMLLSQLDCGEHALSLVDILVRCASVDVVVVDSVATLVPKSELDGEVGDAHIALQARLMSQALRKLSHSLSCSQTILVFVNQVRAKLSTFGGFGAPTEVTCGGNALKFYASVRLNTRRVGFVKKGEEIVGTQIQVKIVKNKHAPPFKTIQLELEFGKGISRDSELIDLGCKHNLIIKAGGSYYSIGGRNFNGKDAIKRFFDENEGVGEELIMKLKDKMLQRESHRNDLQSVTSDERELEDEVVTEVVTEVFTEAVTEVVTEVFTEAVTEVKA